MTTTTMATASAIVLNTSSIEALICSVVDNLDRHAEQQRLDQRHQFLDRLSSGQRVGGRSRKHGKEGSGLAVERDPRIGALGGEFHAGDVAQPHHVAVRGAQRE